MGIGMQSILKVCVANLVEGEARLRNEIRLADEVHFVDEVRLCRVNTPPQKCFFGGAGDFLASKSRPAYNLYCPAITSSRYALALLQYI